MSDARATALTVIVPWILFFSGLLTLPISILLLKIYRQAVLRSMSNPSKKTAPAPAAWEKSFHTSETSSSLTTANSTTLHTQLTQAPWRHAAAYIVGGLAYASVITIAMHLVDQMQFLPFRFIYLVWLYLWPAIITINLVAASSKRILQRSVLGYFGCLVLVGILATGFTPTFSWSSIFFLWAFFNLPTTLLLLAFMHPRIRAVGPLVLTSMMFIVTGFEIFFALISGQDSLQQVVVHFRYLLGQDSDSNLLIISLVLGILIFSPLGWSLLQWIKKRYENKLISDQSLLITAVWIFFTLTNSIGLATGGLGWILCGIPAFASFQWVSTALLKQLAIDPTIAEERSTNLLLLRVFALGQRSEQLFSALSLHWRHIGSIQMIAGPDLINTTIEPHELLDFVTGKLARRFIDSPQTLELRLKEMDLKRDRDHRYRVNDFFCYDNTWKLTLISLLKTSDVILMDLRSFTPQRSGCIFEINTLISLVPLEKIVLLVDNTTHNTFLQEILQTAWRTKSPHSPNTPKSLDQLQIFRFENTPTQLSALLKTLVGVDKTIQPQGT